MSTPHLATESLEPIASHAASWERSPTTLVEEFAEWTAWIQAREMGSAAYGFRLNTAGDEAKERYQRLQSFAESLRWFLTDRESPPHIPADLFDEYIQDLRRAATFDEQSLYHEATLRELMTRLEKSRQPEMLQALRSVRKWAAGLMAPVASSDVGRGESQAKKTQSNRSGKPRRKNSSAANVDAIADAIMEGDDHSQKSWLHRAIAKDLAERAKCNVKTVSKSRYWKNRVKHRHEFFRSSAGPRPPRRDQL